VTVEANDPPLLDMLADQDDGGNGAFGSE